MNFSAIYDFPNTHIIQCLIILIIFLMRVPNGVEENSYSISKTKYDHGDDGN